MQHIEKRLENLYRIIEAQHMIYPEYAPMIHDSWSVDMRYPVPGWWNSYRLLYFGMLRIVVEAQGDLKYRYPPETVFSIADWLRQRLPLPNLWLCGSHSPLSPRYPYHASDIDFVFFISLKNFFEQSEYWMDVMNDTQQKLLPACSRKFGIEVGCGLLAEEFRPFPFLMDAAELDSSQAIKQWDLSLEEVVTILEQRWLEFKTSEDILIHNSQEIIAQLIELFGQERLIQVVAGPRWDDLVAIKTDYRWIDLLKANQEQSSLGRSKKNLLNDESTTET